MRACVRVHVLVCVRACCICVHLSKTRRARARYPLICAHTNTRLYYHSPTHDRTITHPGYTLVFKNVTRVCEVLIPEDCLEKNSRDDCLTMVRRAISVTLRAFFLCVGGGRGLEHTLISETACTSQGVNRESVGQSVGRSLARSPVLRVSVYCDGCLTMVSRVRDRCCMCPIHSIACTSGCNAPAQQPCTGYTSIRA